MNAWRAGETYTSMAATNSEATTTSFQSPAQRFGSRRIFLKGSAAACGGLLLSFGLLRNVYTEKQYGIPITAAAVMANRKPSSEILYRLADNVRNLRRARGYTQQELGSLCQLHRNYLSKVEQATVNITLANLEAIARGLGCAEEDLLRPITRVAS